MPNSRVEDFPHLHKQINVLLADDQPQVLEMLGDVFESVPLYNVHCAGSTAEAVELLESGTRFHVCIQDRGMDDMESDELHLVRNYGLIVPILVNTGRVETEDVEKAGEVVERGACGVIVKGLHSTTEYLSRAAFYAVRHMVWPLYKVLPANRLTRATDLLIHHGYRSVKEWAEASGCSAHELTRQWRNASGMPSIDVLELYQHLRGAMFRYLESWDVTSWRDWKLRGHDSERYYYYWAGRKKSYERYVLSRWPFKYYGG